MAYPDKIISFGTNSFIYKMASVSQPFEPPMSFKKNGALPGLSDSTWLVFPRNANVVAKPFTKLKGIKGTTFVLQQNPGAFIVIDRNRPQGHSHIDKYQQPAFLTEIAGTRFNPEEGAIWPLNLYDLLVRAVIEFGYQIDTRLIEEVSKLTSSYLGSAITHR